MVGETEREEVIIPVRMRDYGSYLSSAIYILLGCAIALGILYYVIIPGKEQQIAAANRVDISSYQEQLDELNATIRTPGRSNHPAGGGEAGDGRYHEFLQRRVQ